MFDGFIKKHEVYIVLILIDLFAIILNLSAYFTVVKFNLFNNELFSFYLIILLIFCLYFMFRAIVETKEGALGFMQIVIHFFLILFLILFTFTLVFNNPFTGNYLADSDGKEIWSNSKSTNLLNSLYFSTITLTTLGYGDIHPVGTYYKIFSIVEVIIGWMFFVIIFANSFLKLKRAV